MNKNNHSKELLVTSLFFFDKEFFYQKIIKPLFNQLKININKKLHKCNYCKKIFNYKLKYCDLCIEKIEHNYHFGGRII